MSLEDIWSETLLDPASTASESNKRDVNTHSHPSSHAALFLSDSEDGYDNSSGGQSHIRKGSSLTAEKVASPVRNIELQTPDKDVLDAMFSGLNDEDPFDDIAPAVDIEKLKRQADTNLSLTRNIVSSANVTSLDDGSSPATDRGKKNDGPKPQKVIPKLNEERILGSDGFPSLLKEYKNFKITGKGNEAADLERLFRIYHAWTHRMYPKFQFRDTVDRVEKLCRTRRMAANLRVWRDKAHGIMPDIQHEVIQGSDDSDREDGGESGSDGPRNDQKSGAASSSRPGTPNTCPGSGASVPPSSTTEGDDDMDIDALLREEEEILQGMDGNAKTAGSYKPSTVPDEDGGTLWAAAGGIPEGAIKLHPVSERVLDSRQNGEEDDEDMWDMFDEAEQPSLTFANDENIKTKTNASEEYPVTTDVSYMAIPTDPSTASEQPTIGADWDDMYA